MGNKKVCFAVTLINTAYCFARMQFMELATLGISVTLAGNCSDARLSEYLEEINHVPVRIARGISIKSLILSFIDYYKLFRHEKFDMIMYATPNAALSAAIAGWLTRVPVRLYCQWGIRYVGLSGTKKRVFKFIEYITCLLSTHVEPISHDNLNFDIKEKLFPPKKGYVVGKGGTHGIDLSKFDITKKDFWRKKIRSALNISDETLVYGYVGRINRDKGSNELFIAFRNILKEIPSSILMLVGYIENEKEINAELLDWAKQSENVVWVPQTNEVREYMSAMDVFVFPTYREGFGQVSLEAQALGIAMITTNIPGPRESTLPGKSAIIIDPGDSDKLFTAMKKLGTDLELCKELGSNGFINVRENFADTKFIPLLVNRRLELLNLKQ